MKKSNVEIEMDREDFVIFKTTCACSLPEHTMRVTVEKHGEADSAPVVSIFYECLCSDFGAKGGWLDKLRLRIKAAATVLATGCVKADEEFLFRDSEHLKDFVQTLEEAVRQVEGASRKAA